MCSCDVEPAAVWREEIRTARRDHTCVECRRPIAVGSKYERVGALHDGSWSTYTTCLDCVGIRKAFQVADRDGCWEVGELFSNILDCPEAAEKMPPEAFGAAMGLLVARRERWEDERQRRLRAQREVAA